ncbi:hypothetical protein BDR26DRAFT_803348 [Obelidium mucronatum]|nr:hypothetical protein BDR26DRAFT_803348 [Obelidium mucronatum]
MKSHHFDTFRFASSLEAGGALTRGQAAALTKAVRVLTNTAAAGLRARILQRSDCENAAFYAAKNAAEVRSELDLLRRNETSLMRTDIESLSRLLDSLSQKTTDKIAALKSEVVMDLNNHKAERRALGTRIDLRIQEIHHKLTVQLSSLKSRLEGFKVEATQNVIWVTIITFGAVVLSSSSA